MPYYAAGFRHYGGIGHIKLHYNLCAQVLLQSNHHFSDGGIGTFLVRQQVTVQ